MKPPSDQVLRARSQWRYHGQERPPFAVEPAEGQESVWDYPRPPRIEKDAREVIVCFSDAVIARTVNSLRVLETASPPTFYLPFEDVDQNLLEHAAGSSHCEWKGDATYWNVRLPNRRLDAVAWSYRDPYPEFESIRDFVSFYPARIDCYVGGHRVEPQPGSFYGGWITPELVGPFKGEPGSGSW